MILLRSETRSGKCAKLRTEAESNNRDHAPHSLYHCLFAPHIRGVVLRAHPVRGESHVQHNANREVATIQECGDRQKSYLTERPLNDVKVVSIRLNELRLVGVILVDFAIH